MATHLTSNAFNTFVPDDMPDDELENEMYLVACETSAITKQRKVMVRAWPHDRYRVSEMVEKVFTTPPVNLPEPLVSALIAEDYR